MESKLCLPLGPIGNRTAIPRARTGDRILRGTTPAQCFAGGLCRRHLPLPSPPRFRQGKRRPQFRLCRPGEAIRRADDNLDVPAVVIFPLPHVTALRM